MREIKFRAWDSYFKCFTGFIIEKDKNNEDVIFFKKANHYSDYCLEENKTRFFLMQYTGLKDKNGVEIYEGDICRCLGGSEFNGHYEYNRIYEVKWQGSGFEMMIDDCGYGWNYSSGFEYIEVIGNIYENPELLN